MKYHLQFIAKVFNIIALGMWIWVLVCGAIEGDLDVAGMVLFIVILPYIALNLIIVYWLPPAHDSWLSLYFKRKRLEEKKRIEALETD